jgi:L-arabinokinase
VLAQVTCIYGEKDRLLALRCQPADLKPFLDIPEGLALWGIDSGERHAVSGSDYGAVRVGAFMGRVVFSAARRAS